MKKLICIALVIAAVSSVAYAAVANLSWQNALQNTDGTSIPTTGPGSLTNTVVEYGPCNTARDALLSVTGVITSPASQLTAVTPDLAPGIWCARARHMNTYGSPGDWTNVVSKVVAPPVPGAPRNFSFGS